MFRLDGKVAAITGGASGIGKAVAKLFSQQGATVHIIDLSEEQAQQALTEITSGGGNGFIHSCDVSNQQQVNDVFSKISGLNILVNNAGFKKIPLLLI